MRLELLIAVLFALAINWANTQAQDLRGMLPSRSLPAAADRILVDANHSSSYHLGREQAYVTDRGRRHSFYRAWKSHRNSWRGLVPLGSTRSDVERVLKAPKSSSHPDYVYETENENVIVRYSTDPCGRSGNAEWNVPIDTVVTITVTPKGTLLVQDLNLDLTQYARSEIAHPAGLVRYISLEDGVGIESKLEDRCEVVMSVTYQPTTKDTTLRCSNSKTASKRA